MLRRWTVIASGLAFLTPAALSAQDAQRLRTAKAEVMVETVARGLENPWSLAFLPDGRMLVSERPGRLRIVTPQGTLSEPIGGVPKVAARGQGGLLDVALDPDFAQNRLVYLSYAEDRGEGRAGTSVMRGKLNATGSALESPQVIFRQQPSHTGGKPLRLAAGLRPQRQPLRDRGRPLRPARPGAKPGEPPRQGHPHHQRREAGTGQPLHRPVRPRSRNLVARAPQRPGRSAQPVDRGTLDRRAWRAGRRRNQHPAKGKELRLAGHHLRGRLFRREDRRGNGETGPGAAGLLLGSLDCALGHGSSTRATLSRPGAATSLSAALSASF